MLSVLHALSQSGSLGANPISFSAPLPVPDLAPQERGVAGGDGGPHYHSLGGLTRSSGVGACEYSLSLSAPTPIVPSMLSVPVGDSIRSAYVSVSLSDVHDSASLRPCHTFRTKRTDRPKPCGLDLS